MLDGPGWAARPTVTDRDIAPTRLVTVAGWPVMLRCWLPSWISDRTKLLDQIDTALAAD